MQIYIHHNGQQTGPFSLETVRAQIANGTVLPTDLAWHEGMPDWLPLSSIPGVAVGAPPPIPGPRTMPPAIQTPETPGVAVASMVLGILGFFFCILTGIPAVICGHIALSRIDRSGGALTGRGFAITGLVTGYLSFFLVFVFAGMALPVFSAVKDKALETQSLSNAKQIALGCKLYASDNDGKFPAKLEDLVPTYVQDRKIFMDPADPQHSPVGYEYFGGKDTDPPDKILLESKIVNHHMRVVVYCDSSGRIQRE